MEIKVAAMTRSKIFRVAIVYRNTNAKIADSVIQPPWDFPKATSSFKNVNCFELDGLISIALKVFHTLWIVHTESIAKKTTFSLANASQFGRDDILPIAILLKIVAHETSQITWKKMNIPHTAE